MTISHSSLHTPHSSLHTPHSSLLTPHSSLLTPHSSLHTPHSSKSGRWVQKETQCPCKPGSVPDESGACHLSTPRVTPRLKRSTLRRGKDSLGRTTLVSAVYMNLQPPVDTARRSPAGWWSLTPPSHPCRPCGRRSFSSAVTCSHPQLPFSEVERPVLPGLSSRTPLRASDRPEHCISGAKVRKILLNRNKEVRQFVRLTIFAPKFARRK